MDNNIPDDIANDDRFQPQRVKNMWCLNKNQSALYLGLSVTGWGEKVKRLKVQKIKSTLREVEVFYSIADLVAIKDGTYTIPNETV